MRVNDPLGKTYFHYPEGKDAIYFTNHLDPKTTIERPATEADAKAHPEAWASFKPGKGKKKAL